MTLTDARAQVRRAARAAGDSSAYKDAAIDDAIRAVCTRFCRVTRCLPTVSVVNLTAATSTVSLTALLVASPLFRPERLMAAYLAGQACPLELVKWETAWRRSLEQPSCNGLPALLSFETQTTAMVWPAPAADTTMRLRWWQPFGPSWVAGVADGSGITLNLPDDYLAEILPDGPPAMLQAKEPEQKYAGPAWSRYLAFEASMMGAGNLGGLVSERAMME